MHERDVALFDAIATALTATDVDRALEAALREIVRVLDLAAGWIWLTDPDSGRFYLAAACDLPPYLREPVQMTGDLCWCMESFVDGDFDSKNVDVIACSRLRRGRDRAGREPTGGLLSHASVALRFGDRPLGLLNLCPRAPRKFGEAELRVVAAIGAQLGLAVERGRLAEQHVSAARTAERTRLAREIHDTLAQDLTAIALQLESALRASEAESELVRAPVHKALEVARASLTGARASVLSLRADPLAGQPLGTALAAHARRLTSESGIRVVFHERGPTALPYEAEGELFRIASEALANARRHAGATRIDVELTGDVQTVALRVRDDGMGFDPASVDDDSHYGLRGMAERAHTIGAQFGVHSTPDGGTTIDVVVPRNGE